MLPLSRTLQPHFFCRPSHTHLNTRLLSILSPPSRSVTHCALASRSLFPRSAPSTRSRFVSSTTSTADAAAAQSTPVYRTAYQARRAAEAAAAMAANRAATSAATVSSAATAAAPALTNRSYLLPTFHVRTTSDSASAEALLASLARKVSTAPLFFKNAPLVLDFGDTAATALPARVFDEMLASIRRMGLVLVGVANAAADIQRVAQERFLPTLSVRGGRAVPLETSASDNASAATQPTTLSPPMPSVPVSQHTPITSQPMDNAPTLRSAGSENLADSRSNDHPSMTTKPASRSAPTVVPGSVRSGQQVYARGADIIVMGSVHSGAEVIADGDVHVYGALKGRALAGMAGDTSARIVAARFQPELVAVHDTFVCGDDLPASALNVTTTVWLSSGSLQFQSCGSAEK